MDNEIRRHVQQSLADHFPHLNVSVGAARLVEDRGIAIHNLVISETGSNRLENNLLVVDELFLECDVQLTRLLRGPPEIRKVILRHSQVWVTKSRNGTWNIEALFPMPLLGKQCPQVVVEDARVTFADYSQPQKSSLSARDIDLTVVSIQCREAGTETTQGSPNVVRLPSHAPSIAGNTFQVKGSFGGPHLRKAEFELTFRPSTGELSLAGSFEDILLNPELCAWADIGHVAWMKDVSVQGHVNGDISANYQLGSSRNPSYEANLSLSGGRLEHPMLPSPLSDLQVQLVAADSGVRIDSLSGNYGTAGVALRMERKGWDANSPITIAMYLESLSLSDQLAGSLPGSIREAWDKFKPTGVVNASVQATFDGIEWRPQIVVTGEKLAFESEKFPYRVVNGSGTLRYTHRKESLPSMVEIDLLAYGGKRPIEFKGQVFDPMGNKLGWMEVTGTNLDINEQVIAALPENNRRVIESLNPEGKFHLHWRIDRTQQDQLSPRTYLRLELVQCRINYDKFPYPINGIDGLIMAEDKEWTFRDIVSKGTREVKCQGHLRPVAEGNELSLRLIGERLPLDDELRKALPDQAKQAWDELRPRGRVDLNAEIFHVTGFSKPSIRVTVQPHPETSTVQFKSFPFLLEQIQGSFNYHDGDVLLSDVSAQHGRTMVRTNGSGHFREDGSWQLQLDGLNVDRLAIRRDLLVALPPNFQKMVDQLRPAGSFRIHNGAVRLAKESGIGTSLESGWDLQLDCQQADFQAGLDFQNVHGTVRLVGVARGSKWETAGELTVDTATLKEMQFTDIRGPIWIDDSRCLVGRWASEKQQQPTRHLSATLYGGTLLGDLWVTYDGLPQYAAEATITDVNLRRLMIERLGGQQSFSGKVAAGFQVRGNGRSLHTLTGDGEVKITEANIYELPLLMGILKVLRSGSVDTTAFNQCDMRFQLQGRHITFDKLDFLGDAVSLYGKGYSNFDQQINLVFHAVMGRNNFRIPFMKNLVDHAGQQIMRMYVEGTLSEPKIHTQAFPGINQIIQQIQIDVDNAVGNSAQRHVERNPPILPRWSRQN